ncbi:MAG: hypothetical protein COX77_01220 [Candidatus Komeilibacteria bacterium CG_4_10_14_0_2_um_filter_37_10]|uniref:Uncharacterized protein n=1 Tax=Candidatus Komeilibacteria bacterium CG_4_10_14_0_2_um_filter_37_10 TaxID=1974470 RepID=A0A2M7VFT4_9BACT|nr:MAG: hypothetical protein COX77_01220 [Candidatus Komeilibacteria bacterium CG_4_10_14_0_2_um_filter_37_10]PJA92583.1 MAG: hypothetical protein CO133_02405 [Candidatus Komeilibacteria bacterium CG_4_9_14_3_um_filter_37_5]
MKTVLITIKTLLLSLVVMVVGIMIVGFYSAVTFGIFEGAALSWLPGSFVGMCLGGYQLLLIGFFQLCSIPSSWRK